jgi:hypothetical protein
MHYAPEPDVIYRPSEALRAAAALGTLPTKLESAVQTLGLDPAIRNVRMSLKEVFVIDNRDPGKGDIYLVTLVTDSIGAEPMKLEVKTFNDVRDAEALQIGPAGLAMYRNEPGKLPRYLDYRILVAESDQELRDAGGVIDEVRNDGTFKSFRDGLLKLTGAAAPTIALATAAADFTMSLMGRILKMNRDDQLIYIAGSFDDAFDDLGVTLGPVAHKNSYAKVTYRVEAA